MNYCPNCQIGIDYQQMKAKHCNNCGHNWEIFHVMPLNDESEPDVWQGKKIETNGSGIAAVWE